MCWNKDVSLNTFIFACFSLVFIYYSSHYTQYRLAEFENEWMYIGLFFVALMQLIEYFLWISIETKDRTMNYWGSVCGLALIILQPILALMVLPSSFSFYRNWLIISYLFITLILLLIQPIDFSTTVAKDKHLSWHWFFHSKSSNPNHDTMTVYIFMTMYFLILLLVSWNTFPIFIPFIFGSIIYLFLTAGNSMGSMWCWIINSLFFFLIFKLLFVLPYCTMPSSFRNLF